jgi:hypothetical protein
MTARWSLSRRLTLEAAAGCAEARWSRDRGRRSDFAFEQLVDELTYGVPRGLAPDPGAARVAATAACPELAREAQQERAARAAPGSR